MARPRVRKPPATASAQSYHLPAPIGGLNTVAAGLAMPSTDCVRVSNLVSSEDGLRSRLGYREWCTGLTGVTTDAVRTISPFSGSTSSDGRLFAATEAGIYEVSASTTTPTLEIAFPTASTNSGYGVSVNVVTSAGHFLLHCDEVDGLFVYTEATSSWEHISQGVGPTQINGFNPNRAAFVAVFKGRVWFVERDTSDAWYLPVGQIYGTATRFPFGSVFREGGFLVGLWNWTYDGGAGIDDSLVAISSGGDVLVYQGTDPSSATAFALRGVWQIGTPPAGRRIASTSGGDLLLLSRQGLVPISRLVVGAVGAQEYATAKISNLINRLMQERASFRDWGIALQPEDNVLMLLVPRGNNAETLQLAQSVASRGWFPYSGLPMLSAGVWMGQMYFGTEDGRVCIHTGYVDAVTLADPSDFTPVDWGLTSAFSNLGAPRQKRVQMLRPLLLSDGAPPTVGLAARYKYDLTPVDPVSLVITGEGATWDSATWDVDVWGGGTPPTQVTRGTTGMGVEVAVAIRGASVGRTVLVGIDVFFTQGGFL